MIVGSNGRTESLLAFQSGETESSARALFEVFRRVLLRSSILIIRAELLQIVTRQVECSERLAGLLKYYGRSATWQISLC